jgi:hypothetical protein
MLQRANTAPVITADLLYNISYTFPLGIHPFGEDYPYRICIDLLPFERWRITTELLGCSLLHQHYSY